MPLTIPIKGPGDDLTAAEFNELLGATNDFVDTAFTITQSIVTDLPQITVGTVAPTSPAVNDIWIDTN